MTDDRSLLERAAKAAGMYDIGPYESRYGRFMGLTIREDDNPSGYCWSPLNDSGQALELAVKLGEKYPTFVFGIFNRAVVPHTSASVVHRDGTETHIEQDVEDDVPAAVRRAIVRAAAALAGLDAPSPAESEEKTLGDPASPSGSTSLRSSDPYRSTPTEER